MKGQSRHQTGPERVLGPQWATAPVVDLWNISPTLSRISVFREATIRKWGWRVDRNPEPTKVLLVSQTETSIRVNMPPSNLSFYHVKAVSQFYILSIIACPITIFFYKTFFSWYNPCVRIQCWWYLLHSKRKHLFLNEHALRFINWRY